MKKYGIFAALAMAVLAVVLVVGCIEPIDTGNFRIPGGQNPGNPVAEDPISSDPAPAVGYVQLNLGGDTNGRALFTPTPVALTDFLHYRLVFTAAATPNGAVNATVDIAQSTDTDAGDLPTIALMRGNYASVTVTAYKDAGTPGSNVDGGAIGAAGTQPIATGTHSTPFSVTTTPGTPLSITLRPITTTGNGTFRFSAANNIGTLGTASAAEVRITPMGGSLAGGTVNGGTPFPLDESLTSWVIASTAIPSGYYFVDVAITAAPDGTNVGLTGTKVFRNMLQVYQNQETVITGLTFEDAHFGFAPYVPNTPGNTGGSISYVHDKDANPITVAFTGDGSGAGTMSPYDPIILVSGETLIVTLDDTDLANNDVISWYADGTIIGTTSTYNGTTGNVLNITHTTTLAASPAPYGLTVRVDRGSDLFAANNQEIWILIQ